VWKRKSWGGGQGWVQQDRCLTELVAFRCARGGGSRPRGSRLGLPFAARDGLATRRLGCERALRGLEVLLRLA